jgi:hypothetical protein
LTTQYEYIENACTREFKMLASRKETAEYFLSCSYPSILFLMLDKKNYEQTIWKLVRPIFKKPFSKHQEETK